MICVSGAREHNLKNISLTLPKNKLIVFTGLSGSGKSSLAFSTLYAEGQRRYVESLSVYARQFLEMMPRPDVDSIEGLCPAISIEQKTTSNNPRSTVGTVTEIYDYLRLLFARVGTAYSPTTGLPIEAQTRVQIVDRILALPLDTRIYLLAPIATNTKGEFRKELATLQKTGYTRFKIDGKIYEDDIPILNRNKRHDISVVVDRLVVKEDKEFTQRLSESVESALHIGNGLIHIELVDQPSNSFLLSTKLSCPTSGFSLPEIEPRLFSFNSPSGACRQCNGLGVISEFMGIHIPVRQEDTDILSDDTHTVPCRECHGYRLCHEALCVRVNNLNIGQVCELSIEDCAQWCQNVLASLKSMEQAIAEKVMTEISNRLRFLLEVGLGYLTLSRASGTLSGGESQRIRLASQIGSGLTGVLYVLDEPSIGLHQKDNDRLLGTLFKLRDLGNTVIVVEHDEDAIRNADYVVDLGPKAGKHGGEIVAQGTPDAIIAHPNSLTGAYLRGDRCIQVPSQRRSGHGSAITIVGAKANNLKDLTVSFPLGKMICVTGVSGCGKSSLVMKTLFRNLNLLKSKIPGALDCQEIQGAELIDKIIDIDQSPIGRTPRSNPATYAGLFTNIREWFSWLPESKARGYHPGRFSFNVKGGRCEACEGAGVITVQMHFLPDVYVPCDVCKGKRYSRETLEIRYKGLSISDVLDMPIEEAVSHFDAIPSIANKLKTLESVGLGYLQVGQKATTLSGGEAQRIKLAKELSRKSTGKTLYILDEPTTGLHFADVHLLLDILQRLVDQGNTVLVIEHNLEVIKTADWIIDLGPEGGKNGGHVVVEGTPEKVIQCPESHTGYYLKKILSPSV